jgi:hypothetical protein
MLLISEPAAKPSHLAAIYAEKLVAGCGEID